MRPVRSCLHPSVRRKFVRAKRRLFEHAGGFVPVELLQSLSVDGSGVQVHVVPAVGMHRRAALGALQPEPVPLGFDGKADHVLDATKAFTLDLFTQAESSATRGAPLATRSLSGPNALKAWSP